MDMLIQAMVLSRKGTGTIRSFDSPGVGPPQASKAPQSEMP